MFAELAHLLLAAQSIAIPLGHPRVNQAPKAPIETAGPMWAGTCDGSDDWNKAAPPVRIHANTYLVGTCGISSILIVGEEGDMVPLPQLDEQEDGGLALRHSMGGVLLAGEPFGQGGQALGHLDQQLAPFLLVGAAEFRHEVVERGGHGLILLDVTGRFIPLRGQAPLAIGARTRLPHSHQEPS